MVTVPNAGLLEEELLLSDIGFFHGLFSPCYLYCVEDPRVEPLCA